MFEANSVVFIDSQIQNSDQLITGLGRNTDIYYLNSEQGGLAQISTVLDQYQNLDVIHIVSHGSEGSLQLGSSTLSLKTINQYRQDIAGWSDALGEDADILFFGCNVGHGKQGQKFIQQLDSLTGADIAASTDLTGAGGDWTLEAATGSIEAQSPFATDSLINYQGTLASLAGNLSGTQDLSDVTVTDNLTLSGDVTLNVGDFTLGESFTISGDSAGARDNLTINSDGKVTIAGDILGGGIKDITIFAKDIVIEGSSLISTRLINSADYDTGTSVGDSGKLTLGVSYSFRSPGDGFLRTEYETDEDGNPKGEIIGRSNALDGALRAEHGGILGNANPTIDIQSGAKLLTHVGDGDRSAAGDITISALDETLQLQVLSFPTQPLRAATIDIDGATIKGNDVAISASGIDPKLFGDVVDFPGLKLLDKTVISPFLEGSASLLQNLLLPASVEVRISQANATVTGSTINASGDVSISTEATADSSVRAHRNIYTADDSSSTASKAAKLTSHIAVAVGYAETDAVTNVEDTTINAGSDVSITSEIQTVSNITARLYGNLQFGGQGADANNYGITGAVAVTDTTSKVLLDKNSSITSGGNVDIMAGGRVESGAKANTSIFSTGNLATGISVNYDDTEVKAIVHGDITATGGFNEEEEHTLIKSQKVNTADNTIAFDGEHGFENGELVTYLNESEGINTTDVGGLEDGETYIVHVQNDQTIQLSKGPAIDINANAANEGAIHSLSRQELQALTPVDKTITVGAVDTASDTITVNNHGLETGNQVAYRVAEGATAIEGLAADIGFHVIVVDSNRIQLADSPEYLAAETTNINLTENTIEIENHGLTVGQEVVYRRGDTDIGGLTDNERYYVAEIDGDQIKLTATPGGTTAIDLTGAGTGTHTFEKFTAIDLTTAGSGTQTIETYVDLKTLVNEQDNTITLADHGLVTGQEVIYRANTTDENEEIEGLIDQASYYVVVIDEDTIQLAGDLDQLAAGNAVDIEAVGIGNRHELDFYHQESVEKDFNSSSVVNTSANTLTLTDHGFYNGQLVRYNSTVSNGNIGGLASGDYYFAIVKDNNTIQLATTRQNVDDEVAINLTSIGISTGTGTEHRLT